MASREARIAARKPRSYYIRLVLAAVFFAVAFRRIYSPLPGAIGPPLLETLGGMAYMYAILAGAFRTYDTLSREKREGTIGLLLLTDLKAFQILFGKLLSASAMTVFGLLAFLPILSLPIIMGGVVFEQFVRLSVSLITALFVSMSWGLFVSAAVRSYLASLTGAAACILLIGFFPLAVSTQLNAQDAIGFPQGILISLFSPALPFTLANKLHPDFVQFFWPSIVFNILLACGWLYAAVAIFPSRCLERPARFKIVDTLGSYFHEWRFGNARQRANIRQRLLESNPLYWLSHRDRVTSAGLMAICIVLLMASQSFNVPELGLFIASLTILFRMAHASSHSISEDQKNGALELLLTTDLTVEEMLSGLNRAMLRRFLWPVALVLIWPWIFIAPTASKVFILFLVCSSILLLATGLTLSWAGPWFALRKHPAVAAWTSLAAVGLLPWLIWLVSIFPGLFDSQYSDLHSIGAVVCSLVGVLHCILVSQWARNILEKNFRAAAADPMATIAFEPTLKTFLHVPGLTVVPIGNGEVRVFRWGLANVRLVAVPAENHAFVEWTGHVSGRVNPIELELQGNSYIAARFTKNS